MKIAQGAKTKIGFIDGKCKQSDETDTDYEQWLRVDCMVRSWILNSIAKDIVEAFLYVNTAKGLWDELRERFGEYNGPMLYQIQREILTVTQGSTTIAQYYTRLKKLWDEMTCLTPVPECSCGSAKIMTETLDTNRLIQFLMDLNDAYDAIRGQILLLEPLPSVNKAYAMVLRVEKQREVNQVYTNNQENNAFLVKMQHGNNTRNKGGGNYSGRGRNGQSFGRGRGRNNDKDNKYCDYCNTPGHIRETCFQLNGFPEWYQQYKKPEGRCKHGKGRYMNIITF